MISSLPPDTMTNEQRLKEVANLLFLGLKRLKDGAPIQREKALDFVTGESVNGDSLTTENIP
jgi:hypothetical protein